MSVSSNEIKALNGNENLIPIIWTGKKKQQSTELFIVNANFIP